jgi:hypothetical protein
MWELDSSNPFFQAASAATLAKPTLQTQLLQQSAAETVATYATHVPEELAHETVSNPFGKFATNLNNLYALSIQQPPQPELLAKQTLRSPQAEQSVFEKNMTQTFSPVLGQNSKLLKQEEKRPAATLAKKEPSLLDELFGFSAFSIYTAAKDSPSEDIFSPPPAPVAKSPFDFLAAAGM